jgi:uncharacterized protein (TIGR03118 family)
MSKSNKPNRVRVRPVLESLEQRQLLSAAPHVFATQTNLVSNQAGVAAHQDANLVNAWGISFAPGGEFWVSDNGTGSSSQYDGTGAPAAPPLVTIPPGGTATTSNPTGQVFTGGTMSFNGTPEVFAFVGEDGGITGWSGSGATATMIRDNSSTGAVYKGATIAQDANGHSELFVANFNSGKVEAYDNTFAPVALAGTAFTDKKVAKGYAPFNVQNIDGNIYVTYAKQNAQKHDDVKGSNHGFVDVFDTNGNLVRRFARGGFLNSPWGVAKAPSTWGSLAGDILVGQFGSGRIEIYSPTGKALGLLKDNKNKPIVIDGLWALTPGPGSATAGTGDIFFSAGPNEESNGLFGKLTFGAAAAKGSTGFQY